MKLGDETLRVAPDDRAGDGVVPDDEHANTGSVDNALGLLGLHVVRDPHGLAGKIERPSEIR